MLSMCYWISICVNFDMCNKFVFTTYIYVYIIYIYIYIDFKRYFFQTDLVRK